MSMSNQTEAKLEAFLEVLEDLISEVLEAGVPEKALCRTLLARAVYQFRSMPEDGCAALDHFRGALERELAACHVPVTE